VLRRGNGYLHESAKTNTRIPPGHPEAFLEAFANVYNGACAAMKARDLVKPSVTVSHSGSYPSGHSTDATLMGIVLSNMVPEKRAEKYILRAACENWMSPR